MKILTRLSIAVLIAVTILFGLAVSSAAATPMVDLGTAEGFAVLGGQAVTNVPNSVITGDVGLSPAAGTNYAGLTPAEVSGTIYAVDVTGPAGVAGNNPSLVNGAQSDLTTAYVYAAGLTPTQTFSATDDQLGGQTLTDGVYAFGHGDTANLIGTLTLDGQGNSNSVFIFQASSDLVTASDSVVRLINGANSCRVFWQVTSSVTFGTRTTFVGNVMALTSITDNGYSTINGSLLARNGQVALNHTTVNCLTCEVGTSTGTGTGTGTGISLNRLPNTGLSFPLYFALVLTGIFSGAIMLRVARRKG
ncbi:MAG: ice-binding family protein [Thermoleophilia bacterium]